MNAGQWGLVLALVLPGCAPQSERAAESPLVQGRTYTAWLYDSQYQKLWERFSPELRQTFGSVTDLASFAGRAVQRLGPERGAADERVAEEAPYRVYSRTVRFNKARDPMVIQWSLRDDGQVTGFVLRPQPADSAAP